MQDANHVRRLNKRRPLENEGLVNLMRAEGIELDPSSRQVRVLSTTQHLTPSVTKPLNVDDNSVSNNNYQ